MFCVKTIAACNCKAYCLLKSKVLFSHFNFQVMNLREKKNLDYFAIHNGPELKPHSTKSTKIKWSTSELFRLEVVDTRINLLGSEEVKVHYIGWDDQYDEWRPKSDVVDTPSESEQTNAFDLLKIDLKVKVKENLHLSRVRDSEITLHFPIQRETFETFIHAIGAIEDNSKAGRVLFRATHASVAELLGPDWWYRLVNAAGDFAYLEEDTIQIWLHERRCLEEFVLTEQKTLEKRLLHRGYLLAFRFVKLTGNRHELYKLGLNL